MQTGERSVSTGSRLPGWAAFGSAPCEVPGENAAAFVAASMDAMPVPFEATVVATGPVAAVRNLVRHACANIESIDDSNCRVVVRSDSRQWLVTVVALLATEFDVVVEEPADLIADVKRLGLRLRAVATRSAT